MKQVALVALVALVCSGTAAFAATRAEQTFVRKAIQGDMAEVQMGQLAQQKGSTEALKSYGKMLANDHQADEQKADNLAKQIGVTAPTAPSSKQKAEYNRLSQMSGAGFARNFARGMIADHRKEIAEFQAEALKSKDLVGRYAAQTLPTLKKHLNAAEKLQHRQTASR